MKNSETQIKAKAKFRTHLIIYLVVICLLTIVNLIVTPGYFWAKWPMMGWGVAIIIHGVSAYYSSDDASLGNE